MAYLWVTYGLPMISIHCAEKISSSNVIVDTKPLLLLNNPCFYSKINIVKTCCCSFTKIYNSLIRSAVNDNKLHLGQL